MAWCRQAPNHYLSQCWPRFMTSCDKSQWEKMIGIKPKQHATKHKGCAQFLGSTCVIRQSIYTISLSSLCRFVWRHWIYKNACRYTLSSMCLRLSPFSELFVLQCMCVFSFRISLLVIIGLFVPHRIIIIKLEVWIFSQGSGLGHETMVCVVCLALFLPCSAFAMPFEQQATPTRHVSIKKFLWCVCGLLT